MKLEVTEKGILVLAETPQDEAYIKHVLNLIKHPMMDTTSCSIVSPHGSTILKIHPCEEVL